MQIFRNFIQAQTYARKVAYHLVMKGEECLAIQIERAKAEGNPIPEKEWKEMKATIKWARSREYHRIMTDMICQGQVRDCILARRFMQGGRS